MAANVDEQQLRDCLARIGWNICQCDAIVREGFESLEALGEMLLKDVMNVCATISKLAANRSSVRIGYALVRRLKDADEIEWDVQVGKDSIGYMDMEDARAENSTKIEPPGKLKDGDWVQWLGAQIAQLPQKPVGDQQSPSQLCHQERRTG